MRSTTLLRYALFVSFLSSFFLIQPTYASRCVTTTAGTQQWGNAAIYPVENGGYSSQPHRFSVEFTVSPTTAGGNVLFGLSNGPRTTWSGIATIVRFKENNTVDVRDGSAYRADTVFSYEAEKFYYVRMEVNVAAHTYSVYIRPGYYEPSYPLNLAETLIAKDYRFRTEQQSVTTLNNMVVESEIGGLRACTEATKPMVRAGLGSGQWQNVGLVSPWDTAPTMVYTFEVQPEAAGSDLLLALTLGRQTTWSGLAAIVRFHDDNTIDVRNGDRYMADVPMTYTPGVIYQVTITVGAAVDGSEPNYSVAVRPRGGDYVYIANRYRFRTEQQGVRRLDNWTFEAEVGGGQARYVMTDSH